MRLANKVALITGAGGPMGRAIALKFASEGASLMLTDISGTRLNQSVEAIAAAHPQCQVVQQRANGIVAQEAAGVATVALDRFGRIDILINVVGGIRSKQLHTPFLEMTEQQWDDTFALNLKPGFHLIKQLAPGMIERGYGRIVNISSVVFAGEPGQCDYAAAKAAVASWTRSLAAEFAPHINVNCIAPGVIRTSVTERLAAADANRLTAASLLKRFGEAHEIADTACFLASDDASFITGEIIAVSGGHHPSL
jgi:3-oxoacyl-[acyl-carrier protein] reductase